MIEKVLGTKRKMGLELGAARLQKTGLGGKENSALWKSGVSANVVDRSEQK